MYSKLENSFDKLSQYAVRIFGNPVSFILALLLVLSWFATRDYKDADAHQILRDVMIAFTFLIFFIMQKSFNRLNTAMHIKLNELVSAHEKASNRIVKVEDKSEEELKMMDQEYVKISKDQC